jgi:hypothetical protein
MQKISGAQSRTFDGRIADVNGRVMDTKQHCPPYRYGVVAANQKRNDKNAFMEM